MKTEIVDGEIVCRIGGPNVFADLGLPNPEARLLKAQLMNAINTEIRIQTLTQKQAGMRAGLKQPELSRIANGRGSGFSVDRLIEVLRRLGRDVEITVAAATGPVGELRFRDLTQPAEDADEAAVVTTARGDVEPHGTVSQANVKARL